jgi:hypothetical protein
MVVKSFQRDAAAALRSKLGEEVLEEWDVAKSSKDAYTREIYCPRLDIAVGPFNIDSETTDQLKAEIERKFRKHRRFVDGIVRKAETPVGRIGSNFNPRCLIAVEIENTGTRKHRLGSILNSGVLGKVGIVVGWNNEVMGSLVKLRKYIDYLYWRGKLDDQGLRKCLYSYAYIGNLAF